MRLALALFTYFPHGGLTRDLIAIARACQQRGHRVRIYAGQCRGDMDDELDVRLVPVNARTNHGKNRQFAHRLNSASAEFAPDLLIGFNKMPRLDVYYAADGCFADKARQRGWQYRITPRCRHYLSMEKAVFGIDSATDILMIARNQIPVFRSFYHTAESRMTMLSPGISRDRVASADAAARRNAFRRQWQLNDNNKLLLAVGSGFRTKGLERSLRALAALPPSMRGRTQLFIVGNDKTPPFEKIVRRLGIHSQVRFVGGRDDVPAFLLGADLLVHPARRENTGSVLLEAMVAGLPAVTTDVCGYAHYVSDQGMGEVLPSPFEQSAFDRAVQRLLEIAPKQWRERGRKFARHADIYDLPLHACRRIEAIHAQHKGRG